MILCSGYHLIYKGNRKEAILLLAKSLLNLQGFVYFSQFVSYYPDSRMQVLFDIYKKNLRIKFKGFNKEILDYNRKFLEHIDDILLPGTSGATIPAFELINYFLDKKEYPIRSILNEYMKFLNNEKT